MEPSIKIYIDLTENFIGQKFSAAEFQEKYLNIFKNETAIFPEPIFEVLDRLFADADAFCADPGLRDEDDSDENELLEKSEAALNELKLLLLSELW